LTCILLADNNVFSSKIIVLFQPLYNRDKIKGSTSAKKRLPFNNQTLGVLTVQNSIKTNLYQHPNILDCSESKKELRGLAPRDEKGKVVPLPQTQLFSPEPKVSFLAIQNNSVSALVFATPTLRQWFRSYKFFITLFLLSEYMTEQ
jgi:hypothetical protein